MAPAIFWRTVLTVGVVLLLGNEVAFEGLAAQESLQPIGEVAEVEADIPPALRGDFEPNDIAAASAWAEQLNLADWLGPLAPLALSPFFGVALLSALSLYGPEWVTDNALLGSAGPLRSVPLLVTFGVLTLLTSLPRLTKVSKPFAQAVDRVEAYAVIVILLVIKLVASTTGGEASSAEAPVAMIQFGIFSMTANGLLMVAMVLNILVINSVKFFFEVMVWLTPFPAVDAMFELCNKTACAALMAVYAMSPVLATGFNLVILVAALLVFRWVHRRARYLRSLALDPVLAWVWPSFGEPRRDLAVFPETQLGPYPAKSHLRLVRDGETLVIRPASSWSSLTWGAGAAGIRLKAGSSPQLRRGLLGHTLVVCPEFDERSGPLTCELTITRRHDSHWERLSATYGIVVIDRDSLDATATVATGLG